MSELTVKETDIMNMSTYDIQARSAWEQTLLQLMERTLRNNRSFTETIEAGMAALPSMAATDWREAADALSTVIAYFTETVTEIVGDAQSSYVGVWVNFPTNRQFIYAGRTCKVLPV